MDLGLFVFLGFFAYSSLIIKSQTNSLFIALPILALGVVSCAILGTYAISSEGILIETVTLSANNSTESIYFANGSLSMTHQLNSTGSISNPVVQINQTWAVGFWMMFHFLLAFVNMVNALYFIKDDIKTKNQFK